MSEHRASVDPGRRLRTLLVAVTTTSAVVLTGCAAEPDLEDRRHTMIDVTRGALANMRHYDRLVEVSILDDGTQPVRCPDGGDQYRYIAYGEWPSNPHVTDPDDQLDDVVTSSFAFITDAPWETPIDWSAPHTGMTELEPDGPGPRELRVAHEDLTLTLDFFVPDETKVLVRIAGSTSC